MTEPTTLFESLRNVAPPIGKTTRAFAELAKDQRATSNYAGDATRRSLRRSVGGLRYAFSTPPRVGLTEKTLLHERGTLKLFHYRARTDEVYRVPLLLVMSLVSKPYILDLQPNQSLIEYLVEQGYDVYMIDWGIPRPQDKALRLENYVLDLIPECLDVVHRESGEDDVSMLGYCMGGLLACLYAALHPNGPLSNLACLTTPVDFDGMGLFKAWSDPRCFDVDALVDAVGNIPPRLLYRSFQMLRPLSTAAARVRLWDNLWNEDFVHGHRLMDRWGADQIPFPGECFRQTTKELMQQNKLIKGELELGGRRVDLGQITVPFVHTMALHDHIVPYAAAKDLSACIGSRDKSDYVIKGGHVSLVAGSRARFRLWPQLDEWLSTRST